MPKKKNRVNSALFNKLLKYGKRYSAHSLSFLFFNNTEQYKFSVVVPKKIAKKASKRNRIKRIVREIIKKELEKENINNIHFVAFIKQKPDFDKLSEFKDLVFKDLKLFLTKNQNIS